MTTTATIPSAFDLTGRRTLVTGASRGIGRAIAVGFARLGAHVVGAARSEKGLEETAELAADAAGSFEPYAVDLRSPSSVEECVAHAAESLGGLDVLVNNAADDHDSPIEATDLSVFQRVVELNLQSCWVMIRAASPHLQDGGGKVINIASVLGLVAIRDDSAYIAAKHGLIGVTRAVALEWARKGVQVNAIAPGYVETAMLPDLNANEAVAEYIRRSVPMGRWSQPDEYTAPAVFLASAASDYVTGQVLVVDGGLTAQ
ncbi:SDR family oxidoreductase [Actinomadura sp. KC216]|uniref:SDR family NAD(P)-dependent oxidoreductase n=1 Tax=Actinomadura sp. KC216 TaxID=2530370 RepID=UPI00105059D6|nr:SDR family oxidoreductase [Actinomadura sp. KC216]TDB88735.1 SDR family oxidoreductase [Actinomadura sp. KC216]